MAVETKTFPLRTVLTVTTGRLLTKPKEPDNNGSGDLYELLGWMTNDSPMTHQLGRFVVECKPWLLRWFPELAKAPVDLLDTLLSMNPDNEVALEMFLHACAYAEGLKPEYDVPRIPADDHASKNPIDELVEMRGGKTDGIIVLVKP